MSKSRRLTIKIKLNLILPMQKIYTADFKTSPKNEKEIKIGLKTEVLNNILNFSKSLEVLKANVTGKTETRNVEIILN